jgi:ribonuclease E
MSYGEMTAEVERAEEAPAEKPAAKPHREKGAPPEDETVVLGGDSPISFDKALGEAAPAPKDTFKYDRRDLQRAALDERERLRALFESAKPEDEEGPEAENGDEGEAKGEGGKRKRRRRRRKGGSDRAAEVPAQEGGDDAEAPAVETEPLPEPPKVTADLVASLLTPSPRPKLGSAPATDAAAPAKPKRTPRAKVVTAVEAPASEAAVAPEQAAPEEAKPAKGKGRARKIAVIPETPAEAAAEAPKAKAPRAKKAPAKKTKAE